MINQNFESVQKKPHTGIFVIIIVLLLLVIGGLCVYTFYLEPKYNNTFFDNSSTNDITDNNSEKTDDTNTAFVKDGIVYEADWGSKKRNINVPIIVTNNASATELNAKMAKDVISSTYNMYGVGQDVAVTTKYNTVTKNNVIAIEAVINYEAWMASGNGVFKYYYFYDIAGGKTLSIGDGIKAMGYSLSDIAASSYDELNNVSGCSSLDISIDGGSLKVNYHKALDNETCVG